MKGRILGSLAIGFTMVTLVLAAMPLIDLTFQALDKDDLGTVYAMGRKHRANHSPSPAGGQGETSPQSVPEPSTLILIGSALGAGGLYKILKSRKRRRND